MPDGLGRAERVDQHHAGLVARAGRFFESSLHITPDEAIMSRLDRSQRPGSASSAREHRLGEGVADDGDRVDLLALDRVEQLVDVELARLASVTTEPPMLRMMSGVNMAGAVHQRAGRQADRPGGLRRRR